MQKDEFRHMRRGEHLSDLREDEVSWLKGIDRRGKGKKSALLMLHGFTSSPAVYREMLPHLPAYDAIVCPPLPGHAASIAEFSRVHAADWLEAAQKTCVDLVAEYERVDLMGLSLGGLLASMISQKVRVHHLYLLAPALQLHLPIPRLLSLAKGLDWLGFSEMRNAAGNLCSPTATEISYRRVPIRAISEILKLIQSFHWQAPHCPVDLFLGRHDEVVDSAAVLAMIDDLSKVKVHWLEHSAHVLPLDQDQQVIIDCLRKGFKA